MLALYGKPTSINVRKVLWLGAGRAVEMLATTVNRFGSAVETARIAVGGASGWGG